MPLNHSVAFFDSQFKKQVGAHEFVLNPFEQAVLPFLKGRVLDLGCGLGNLTLAAARRGCDVVAVDGSPTAIEHLANVARDERLRVTAACEDIQSYAFRETYDVVVAIGLLMFFPRPAAVRLLDDMRHAVGPGGCAAVNVLIAGTTFMDMFDPDKFHLFTPEELESAFSGWTRLLERQDDFAAPHGTVKRFTTVVARRV